MLVVALAGRGAKAVGDFAVTVKAVAAPALPFGRSFRQRVITLGWRVEVSVSRIRTRLFRDRYVVTNCRHKAQYHQPIITGYVICNEPNVGGV